VGLYLIAGPAGIIRFRKGKRIRERCADSTVVLQYAPQSRRPLRGVGTRLRSAHGSVVIELADEAPDYSVCAKLEFPIPGAASLDVVGCSFVPGGPRPVPVQRG